MAERVLVGINPATRKCELVALNDESNWQECRTQGLIPFPVAPAVARRIFGDTVPCLDALLPTPDAERRVFVHVVGPEFGDDMFYPAVTKALQEMAALNERSGADELVRAGVEFGEGEGRVQARMFWPEE